MVGRAYRAFFSSGIRGVRLDYWRMSPQDALEPGLCGSILTELSLDCGISELRFHAGHFFFLLDKNNTSEGYLWRSMNGWD